MRLPRRRRLQWNRVLFLVCMVGVGSLYQLSYTTSPDSPSWPDSPEEASADEDSGDLLKVALRELSNQTIPESLTANVTERTKIRHCIFVDPEPVTTVGKHMKTTTPSSRSTESPIAPTRPHVPILPHAKGEYPTDLFSIEQRRQGWVGLHIFGMTYVFVALAIVCDEFFVPALGVITDKLQISEDVAGATFMAAGGSAPELFTSLIGVFISHSNIGIGTIVGSAVFNILFVIGTCALFSREILHLTWWPLFRDVSFYILDLIMLIIFFLDNVILWWESMLLLSAYCLYVIFMKWNVEVEQWVKHQLLKRKRFVKVMALEDAVKKNNGSVTADDMKTPEDNNRLKLKPFLQRGSSSASLHNSTLRSTIFQLMIHTLDPLGEAAEGEKPDGDPPTVINVKVSPPTGSEPSKEEDGEDGDKPREGQADEGGGDKGDGSSDGSDDDSESDDDSDDDSDEDEEEEELEEEPDEPLSLEWPDTKRKQITYLFLLPIVFPLWLTVPDVRSPKYKKYFALTFLGSIMWIAIFSYLMVWWAHQVGETVGISEEIMGLTILAAGTSIPDLITSVIVARKGLGDMAVSSSVGSNIFDITVGLPVPWLLFSMFNGFSPVAVSSNGLFCAIVLLFLMLLFVIFSIAACKWKMNKFLGFTMFALYFVFLIVSVMLEDRIIICPISI
ncbi:sodium/potassium/calcium exchanger 1 isoform X2 [Pleurodeles waltl]|uniref:sodium/potassium/calcium exchanger 1 isoform X2 n=1 Tax=Pleurodeles waltl TaxID=8319 RepID=UPI003709A689